MEFIGTYPTEKEKERILCPYSKNKGEKWTVDLLVECIENGNKAISQDEELCTNISAGVNMLKNTSN